jgi:hypothetical protein
MNRLGLLVLFMLLMFLPLSSSASDIDLLNLNIPTSRVPTWYPFDETTYEAAQSWDEYDVTCTNAWLGIR